MARIAVSRDILNSFWNVHIGSEPLRSAFQLFTNSNSRGSAPFRLCVESATSV